MSADTAHAFVVTADGLKRCSLPCPALVQRCELDALGRCPECSAECGTIEAATAHAARLVEAGQIAKVRHAIEAAIRLGEEQGTGHRINAAIAGPRDVLTTIAGVLRVVENETRMGGG